MVIGSLLMSGSIVLVYDQGPTLFEMPVITLIFFALAGTMGFVATVNYLRR
jgi:hypothetical protein